jgi:hypothetical protein
MTPNAEQQVDVDDVAKSIALLQAAGYRSLPLAHPIGSWQILAVNGRGLLLAACCKEWPKDLARFGLPANFPAGTTKILHKWGNTALPETQAVS